jgi:hypothetical protein
LPIGATTSPLPTVIVPVGTTTPATTSDLVPQTTPPPILNIPEPPTAFASVDFREYRSAHPNAGQAAAVPAVLLELTDNTSFEGTFGPLVPEASHLATDLTNATGWTTLRKALETYLLYVRSLEAITWKQAKSDLEALDAVFQGVLAHNPALLDELPALARLLDVQKQIGLRSAATRVATAKAKVAQTAATTANSTAAPVTASVVAAPEAQPAPVVNPSAVVNGSGGVAH